MCAVGPIVIGTSSDIYEYAGKLVVDGMFDLNGGALASGQGLIQQFQAPHGPVIGLYTKEVESAALSGATSNIGSSFIPAGSCPLFISLYNTVLITGCTSYTAGDGTTADLFGTGLALTVGDTANKWKTATSPKWYASAADLVLTAAGGAASFSAGKVRGAMLYLSRGALLG